MKVLKNRTIEGSMKALILTDFGAPLEVQEIPIPKPKKGQVLIHMLHSPINPSDDSFVRGEYSSEKTPPVIPGFEGVGEVIASGGGFMANRVLGKYVAGFAPTDSNGTWAEYMVTDANLVVPIHKDLDKEQAAMMFVNPLTAYAFVDIAKKKKAKAILNSPGAGALGRMLQPMCDRQGIELVNLVRSEEQVNLLKSSGSKYVLNSTSPTFQSDLKSTLKKLNVKLAFESIGGELPNVLLNAMPAGSEVKVYGRLSGKDSGITNGALIFEKKSISGFWLSQWITTKNPIQLLMIFNKIQKFLTKDHHVTIHKKLSLTEVQDGLAEYMKSMSKGKMLVSPRKD